MSIIAQQTPFTFTNCTEHFLEIRVVAEQDDSFRMSTSHLNNVFAINTSDLVRSDTMFTSFVHGLLRLLHGEKLHEIKINLPAGQTAKASVRCASTLYFTTNILSQHTNNNMSGEFELGPEYHGDPIKIEWSQELGFAYTASGDVSIGTQIPTTQDVSINSSFFNKKNRKFSGPDVTPACCKIDISTTDE